MIKILITAVLPLLFLPDPGRAKTSFRFDEYNAEANFKRGVYYYNETKYLPAAEFFIKALQHHPRFYPAMVWLGKAYFKAGYLDNALSSWQDAVDAGGADNFIIEKLNNVYFRLGRADQKNLIRPYVHFRTIDGNMWDAKRFSQPVSVIPEGENGLLISALASRFVLHLDANDKVLHKYAAGKKSFQMPYGLALDQAGNIIVSDLKRDRVEKLSRKGKLLFSSGGTGTADGRFLGPEALCVDRYNNILVVDVGNCRVQKLSPEGRFMMKFGSQGDEEGLFLKPSGITADQENNIYVSDGEKLNIQKFDEDGNYLETVFGDKKFTSLRSIRSLKDMFLVADGGQGGFVYSAADGTWMNVKNFQFGKEKLLFVSDMFMTKEKSLYLADFLKNTVEVFVPEMYKYANLQVDIETVDTSSYPRVVLYAGVTRKDGSPVANLSRENFQVRELGVRMTPLDLLGSVQDRNRIKTLFLVEKSPRMKEFTAELKEAASFFLDGILNTKDEVRVDNFHRHKWTDRKYDFSRLRILAALEEDNYNTVADVSLPLYEGVTELMNKLSRRALILFTTGEYDLEKNFKSHSTDVCARYAAANHVPVFIVNFTSNNEKELKELCRSTGGQYYAYFKDLKRLKNIRSDIVKVPVNRYVVVYETARNRALAGTWREIDVQVDFNKLTGKDRSGYFVPE